MSLNHIKSQIIIFIIIFNCFNFSNGINEKNYHTYTDGATQLKGYFVPSQCKISKNKGTILIVHQWMGLSEYEVERAHMLAKECYNSFAVDMYGIDNIPENLDQAKKASSDIKAKPDLLRSRIKAAVEYVKGLKRINPDKIGIIGYCFGGGVALELARTGEPLFATVVFHGNLNSTKPANSINPINSKVFIHHGLQDPHIPENQINDFFKEMKSSDTEYTFYTYPGAVHGFTEKKNGDNIKSGAAYNEYADKLSWKRMLRDFDDK